MVFVVLPVHNRRLVTEKCVGSLLRQSLKDFKLLLIDDGSTDGTSEKVLEQLPESIVVRGSGNWWWGGSLAQAWKWLMKQENVAPTDLVCILNDDTTFEPDFLEKAERILQTQKKALLLAQCYSKDKGELIDTGNRVDWKKDTILEEDDQAKMNCFSTRGLFLRVGDLKSIGNFKPILLPHYASDYEYTIRAFRKGFRFISDPEVRLALDTSTSGHHNLAYTRQEKWRWVARTFFSKKSPHHVRTTVMFPLIAYPFPYNIKHSALRLIRAIKSIIAAILGSY